ncbi:MAG: T9SS type A sorting domain-containing protein [Bacteroidota bacterium]
MKSTLHFVIFFCLSFVLSSAAIDVFAWGGDVTLPVVSGNKYSNARISVAYDGTIYYGRIFSTVAGGSFISWEVLKSTDNGITFIPFSNGAVGGSSKCTALDIICAGENATDFAVYIARAYLDTVTTTASLYADKYNATGGYASTMVNESFSYSTSRGWSSLSFATDSRDPNPYSTPYAISLAATMASTYDSVIVWTGNDGGTTIHRRSLFGTPGFLRNVSASIGSIAMGVTGYGRLGVTWDDYANSGDDWGVIETMFLYPDDGTNSQYPGPYTLAAGVAQFRRPCIVMSENTAGGTGPGTSDFRLIVSAEWNGDNGVWGAVYDSILLKIPSYNFTRLSIWTPSGNSTQCHGVFDPLYNNFLFTYCNDVSNSISYVIKFMNSPQMDYPIFFNSNFRDINTASSTFMAPRVDMSVSRGMAAFAWNDNYNSLFDAEWSVIVGVRENSADAHDLNIFPNPASEITNISCTADASQKVSLFVMDITGRVLLSREVELNAGSNSIQLSVNALAAGNYFIQLKGATINSTLKLVVTK